MYCRATISGIFWGALFSLGIAAVTWAALHLIDIMRGPHLELYCTASHTVSEIQLQPSVDGQGYSTLIPMNVDRTVCDVGYNICVNRGSQVDASLCK